MPLESFWRVATEEPARLAVVEPTGEVRTAGELHGAANQLVHALRDEGLVPGDVVAVVLESCGALLELYLAAMQAGWYFLPLNPRLTAVELAYVLEDARARVVVGDAASAPVLAVATRELPALLRLSLEPRPGFRSFAALKAAHPTTPPLDRTAGDRLAYTSGTTGRPKAVMRPLEPVSPEQRAAPAALHLRMAAGIKPRGDTVHLASSPLYHSAALLWCTDHMHLGHPVVLLARWTPEGALERIQRHRVTSTFMVPTHFRRLLALPEDVRARYDVSSLRHVVHSGAPCPVELKRRMLAWWGPVLYETYASTEGPGTQVGPDEWLAHPGTVGRATDRVRVLRDDGERCAPGEVGAIYLALGPRAFDYRGDPAKTSAGRRDGYFTVGDIGYIDADGYLFLSDRSADVVITGGVNVYPAEVEAVLGEHPLVADCAVFGIPDEEWGEQVKAVVELVPGAGDAASSSSTEELLAFCRARLASFKCPRTIDVVPVLPRDPNGKLYKRRLRDPYWSGRERKI